MEEILQLLKENNQMLKRVISYINKVNSEEYQLNEDMKDLVTNLIANTFANNRLDNKTYK